MAALDAGAVGYLLKDAEPQDSTTRSGRPREGEAPLAPKAAAALLAERGPHFARRAPELTGREREILALVLDGMANKQIARRLGISEKTVKGHLTNVFQRIGVTGPDAGRDLGGAQRHVPWSRDRSPLVMTPSGRRPSVYAAQMLGPLLAAAVAAALFAAPASAKAPVQRHGPCEMASTHLDPQRPAGCGVGTPSDPIRRPRRRPRQRLAGPAVGR